MLFKKIYIIPFSLLFALLCISVNSFAQENSNTQEENKVSFKLTPSYYFSSDKNNAEDVNLRAVLGAHTAWIGYYRDDLQSQQARVGYEYRHDFGFVRPIFSGQFASGGFFGGSITAEVGGDTYALVGWGRTNLKNYYNLNFDPNDAITLGIGSRALPKTELSFFQVWDDRLDTKQHITHAVIRYKSSQTERWTLDISYKRGMTGDGNTIAGTGLTGTYDFGDYFVRFAHDQYANFTNSTQNRLSVGMRF